MREVSVAALELPLQKQVESARAAFERGNHPATVALCQTVLASAPGCLPVRKLHRAAQLKCGPEHGGFLVKALSRVSIAPFLVSGKVVLTRDPAKAIESAQKVLESDPHSSAALRMLGQAASSLGWHETAVFAFEARKECEPDDLENLLALGEAYLASGQPGPAVQSAATILHRDPGNGPATALLKDASVAQSLRTGRWEEAGDFRGKVKQP